MPRFTDRYLLSLKPKADRYEKREQDGFVVRVYPTGRKVFQYVYTRGGKTKRATIGEFDKVWSLQDAREEHRRMYAAVNRGLDPTIKELTVKELRDKFEEECRAAKRYTEKSLKDQFRMLDKDIIPVLGSIPISEIQRINIQKCLEKITKREALVSHNRTLEFTRVMFEYACDKGYLENNPAARIKPHNEKSKNRVLTDDEIREVFAGGDSDSNRALKLQFYTAARPGEAQNIKYEDIRKGWWICDQLKGGGESQRLTYLTPDALDLIGTGSGRVFPKLNQVGSLYRYTNKKYKRGWTPHDIRRTVSTRLAEMGYPPYLRDRLLGHQKGKLSGTYDIYAYADEIKKMLILWNRQLRKIISNKL